MTIQDREVDERLRPGLLRPIANSARLSVIRSYRPLTLKWLAYKLGMALNRMKRQEGGVGVWSK